MSQNQESCGMFVVILQVSPLVAPQTTCTHPWDIDILKSTSLVNPTGHQGRCWTRTSGQMHCQVYIEPYSHSCIATIRARPPQIPQENLQTVDSSCWKIPAPSYSKALHGIALWKRRRTAPWWNVTDSHWKRPVCCRWFWSLKTAGWKWSHRAEKKIKNSWQILANPPRKMSSLVVCYGMSELHLWFTKDLFFVNPFFPNKNI